MSTEIQRSALVLIKWQDCETLEGWHDVPTLIDFASQPRIIWTVGFLIDENDERYVLSSSWETTFGKIAGGWIIPKSQVHCVKIVVEAMGDPLPDE